MNRTATLLACFTLGIGIIANACGGGQSPAGDSPSEAAGTGGSSGRGTGGASGHGTGGASGHGSGGASAGRATGTLGEAGMSDDGGSGTLHDSGGTSGSGGGTGGHMGLGGRPSSGRGGRTARGGGGGAGGTLHATGGSAAGAGGESGTHEETSASGAGGEGGGASGAGSGNAGGEGGASTAPACTELSVGPWDEVTGNETLYFANFSPNLGSSAQDELELMAFSDDVGLVEFGVGEEGGFFSCFECLRVEAENDSGPNTQFFAMSGTLNIGYDSQPEGGVMDATLSDVTLVELDPANDYLPIPGGQCLHLASASISLP